MTNQKKTTRAERQLTPKHLLLEGFLIFKKPSYTQHFGVKMELAASIIDAAGELAWQHFNYLTLPIHVSIFGVLWWLQLYCSPSKYSFCVCFKAQHGRGREVPTKAASHSGENVFVFFLSLRSPFYRPLLCALNQLDLPPRVKIILPQQRRLTSLQWNGRAWSAPPEVNTQRTFPG